MNEPKHVGSYPEREINLSPKEISRFWNHVVIREPADCWLWTKSTAPFGYGRFSTFKRHLKAHRVAWTVTHGPIPSGMKVCHNCPDGDNTLCCNPSHLFLGTQKENMQDAAKKGRTYRKSVGVVFKLTEVDIPIIRERSKIESARSIARDLKVSPSAITAILRGERWAHVA